MIAQPFVLSPEGTSSSQPEELCLVCQDISTGYHYGVPSCNGCKTFFRRTLMKNQSFTCQFGGKCPVDKSIRCACRHCRFEKCLKVGMDRNAIQQSRDPIGYTKRTRRYPPIKPTAPTLSEESTPPMTTLSIIKSDPHREEEEDARLRSLVDVEALCERLRHSAYTHNMNLVDEVNSKCLLEDKEFMRQHNVKVHDGSILRHALPADYHFWNVRDCMIMVEWAKTMPEYQRLPIEQKLSLLHYSVITYSALTESYYTVDKGPDTIVFPSGAFFNRDPEPFRPAGFNRKKLQMLDQLMLPMREMGTDLTEFVACKAIFFLNPDVDDLDAEAKKGILEARGAITNALFRYMVRVHGMDKAGARFGRLLLIGTSLATMSVEMREAVVIADTFDQIKFSPFARQLLRLENY